MAKSVANLTHDKIKTHILSPEKSTLDDSQQFVFERIMSVARVLDKNPTLKHSVALHRAKYPEISQSQAYEDVKTARKLFNSLHEFDYDFWQTWLINDIVENIKQARNDSSPASRRVIAQEHANLIKAIGDKPDTQHDPRLTEKHEFFIVLQTETGVKQISDKQISALPAKVREEITNIIFKPQEITDAEAEEIMNT